MFAAAVATRSTYITIYSWFAVSIMHLMFVVFLPFMSKQASTHQIQHNIHLIHFNFKPPTIYIFFFWSLRIVNCKIAGYEYPERESMRSKSQPISNIKLLFLGLFLTFILLFVLRSNLSSPILSRSSNLKKQDDDDASNCSLACNKMPRSIAQTLVHYTSSTITPQQTLKEMSVTAKILEKKSPCNFLVFGLGHDSLMWSTLNYGGRTVFLEEDEAWITQIRRRFPMLESYHVTYDSKVNEAENLMEAGRGPECIAVSDPRYSMCQLALKGLPTQVYETQWDLIMVDAPTGYYEEAPGRMTAIYTAGMMARNREDGGETHVFVHDVNREVEDTFSKAFLCEGYMKKQEGRIRHFTIPSHRSRSLTRTAMETPFCPELN